MSILQISKLQVRTGNLVDLPQLDEGEFGWATDNKRLFVGKTTPNENIEVLTGYSKIAFSQIDGVVGNLLITSPTAGQVLAYNGSSWVNTGGSSGGTLNFGSISNVKITGGAIGYVLSTDGLGNLSWTPKGSLYTNIVALSNDTPVVMTVANTTPYTNDLQVTISGVNGVANANVNGNTFYVKLASDFPSSGNVSLYTDAGLTTGVNGTGLTYTNSPNAIATAIISSGSGTAAAGGSNTSIQYNASSVITGDANLVYDYTGKVLSLNGDANVGNLNSNGIVTSTRFVSNVTTGTAPFTVTSTTQVANLNSATAGTAGTVTTNAQPNITSVGTLTSLTVTGNISGANIIGNHYGAGNNLSNIQGANVSGAVAYATTANAVAGANVSGAVGLATYATTANAVAGGNVSGTVSSATSATNAAAVLNNSASTGTYYIPFISSTANGNYTHASNANFFANLANGYITATGFVGTLSGSATSATTAGTVTTNAQPNITSVGTLSAVSVTANVTTGGIKTDNYYYANGVAISFDGAYSNSNVASYLPTYTGTVGATALTTGANTTAGTITGNWSLSSGSKLQSTYADLAEYYTADISTYEPGTVLQFGGTAEVTVASPETSRVAGVVSTNPAFAMHEICAAPAVPIALQGRVPCKVTGSIRKGDMLVSAGYGRAMASSSPSMGTVIGKSLEDFDGLFGVIEVAVGRL